MVLLALLKRPCPSALSRDGVHNHDPHAPSGVGPFDDTRTEQRFRTFPFPRVRLRHCSPTEFADSCGLPIGCVHRIVRGRWHAAVVPESGGARWLLEKTRETQQWWAFAVPGGDTRIVTGLQLHCRRCATIGQASRESLIAVSSRLDSSPFAEFYSITAQLTLSLRQLPWSKRFEMQRAICAT